MRRPFTTAQAVANGVTLSALKWGVATGSVQRVERGVYMKGDEYPSPVERRLARLVRSGGVASHSLAGLLLELDGINLSDPCVTVASRLRQSESLAVRRLLVESVMEVRGYRCTDGTQTMLDLASMVNDVVWEQALESALRKRLTTIPDIEVELPRLSAERWPGVNRVRRVLGLRSLGVPATESLLETLMVQLIRSEPVLPEPTRQVEVRNEHGDFVARVDLAYPEHGVFIELDGQQHKDQPVYDAVRQTAVVATTRWLPGRFTWDDIVKRQRVTLRRLRELLLTQ